MQTRTAERAIVIIPAYRCATELERCAVSVQGQDWPNMDVIVCDDASEDETTATVEALSRIDRWTGLLNPENRGATANIDLMIRLAEPQPDDVIILVDGDDWLPHSRVVSRVMREYDDHPDCWLTYGSYHPDPPDPGCPVVCDYPPAAVEYRSFRSSPNLFNHLITFKAILWAALDHDRDLHLANGEWVPGIYDEAFMYPFLEMAAPNHYRFIAEDLYVYNSVNPLSCSKRADWRASLAAAGAELCGRPKKPRMTRRGDVLVPAVEARPPSRGRSAMRRRA